MSTFIGVGFTLTMPQYVIYSMIVINKHYITMIIILNNGYENLGLSFIIDSDVLKFIKYFVIPKYGFSWHFFDNIGPRKNNHLEGYHAKLSSIPSAKANNVITFINMIKNSASQVHSEFHANERNPIAEPKQISKNKKKGRVFVTLQEQFSEQILTFEQYFDKLSANVIEPYGTSQMKFDQDEEEQNDDKVG
ncbi:hypothetical protein BpHYR1_024126 [Brachionus plicatilis]|uniref:Uncharacterized protein n=1 Tax=Brachionus plicatilis TaxID=10195 RepID=A0A3M7TAR8_BRAPC|nr:hypothetical protein BpHYR1_024126 [Brachionus plicatilis]